MFSDDIYNEPSAMLDRFPILSSNNGVKEWFSQDPEPEFIYD